MKRPNSFVTIRTEGGLLPADLLVRISSADSKLAGLTPAGYHLAEGERLNEAINRSWNRLVGAWAGFRDSMTRVSVDDRTGTNITRARWSLVLFQELGYGQLQPARSSEIDGKSYPISHVWGQVPIHLVGAKVDLDHRTEGIPGAATMSPHGLVQEYLNRSDDHLWGLVSNGLLLRLMRDNAALTRQAFVEFDLEAMLDGQEYADFVVLWLLCHQSRLEGGTPSDCLLEQWSADAAKQGVRALDQLRNGVETAISALGTGFIAHPANAKLREQLRSGVLNKQEYYRQLLRLVYRLIFLFVAEERNLLIAPDASPTARERYTRYYSVSRIRDLANRRRGGPHGDLWRQVQIVFEALSRAEGAPELGLPGLGSFLWSDTTTPDLDTAQVPNRQLLSAVLALTSVADGNVRRGVDYRNLDSEELGSIYESLLELHPELSVEGRRFSLMSVSGNERKTTGSYYTPTRLITALLDAALEPVLSRAAASMAAESAILDLKVLDPACGSGHFLIAAAHRIAKRLAAVRTGDDEPSPEATRHALRDVIGRCLHGIDLNPMAVELCKVSLWMEAMDPGKPLGFLDHRIVCGNALLGATPELLDAGIPDDAFKPLDGDDKLWATSLKRRNRVEREGGADLFSMVLDVAEQNIASAASAVDDLTDADVYKIRAKEAGWRDVLMSSAYISAVGAANAWCAAFVVSKQPTSPVITHGTVRSMGESPDSVPSEAKEAIEALASEHRFLHWHLAFLAVRGQSERPGFDVVLGNPPWLSYSGRQQAPLDPRALNLLKSLYPQISAWPAAHSAFLLAAVQHTRLGGGIGLVLPYQVSDLESYGAVRSGVAELVSDAVITDVGEDAFEGVSQRAALFAFVRSETGVGRRDLSFSPVLTDVDPNSENGSDPLMKHLSQFPTVDKAVFADPGVHTGNVSKKIVVKSFNSDDLRYSPVREGKDINFYRCGLATKGLLHHPNLDQGEYCRIQPIERYQSVPILLRQTANRPIACRHLDRTYFRNSILACNGIGGVPDRALVGILNSRLIGHWYRSTSRESGQKAFPQVKVGAMRGMPMFTANAMDMSGLEAETLARLAAAVETVESLETSDKHQASEAIDQVDLLVFRLFGVDDTLAEFYMASLRALE